MKRYEKILVFQGAVETLEYFSKQIAETLKKNGYEVFVFDMQNQKKSLEKLKQEMKEETVREKMALLTFNFIGLSGEENLQEEDGEISIWEAWNIDCFCIMVDHPMYYYKQLSMNQKNLKLICIDRDHKRFVEEYYPEYRETLFLPLGGTELRKEKIPYENRKYDLIFAGNYVPLEKLMKHLEPLEEENKEFIFEIIDDLIAHPMLTMEQAIITHLKQEIPEMNKQEIPAYMYHMIFVDLYVRSFFRRKIVCELAEAGMKVVVLGKDWELAECRKPENLIQIGQVDSKTCLEYMENARVSLNIMPWFKDGAHDRIFNAMLSGCVCVTDSSKYLDEWLVDEENAVLFELSGSEHLSEKVRRILKKENGTELRVSKIAEIGYKMAKENHTWENRMKELLNYL